ncbi:hypothetical protein O6H91_08G113100 [Diphasiastrum complanatum]|uniref:Uncharacterized protein n=1 Tax=Diphasiastrum complanatum TaxID=34168 RepID=A0ACC2D164_DIPCM|nr:hypothetical protein O6H91_08G113100 [Diphasiastrum complanatum]
MAGRFEALLLLLLLLGNFVGGWTADSSPEAEPILGRRDFPYDFVFGVSSSAYQYEGAVKVGGRGPTVLDVFAHTPGNIKDGSNADVAVDQFHRFKSDAELMKDINLDAYRLSIEWTRLFPEGRGNKINQAGVDHYNRVFNSLLENGLKPYVTLQHFDIPQALEESYGSLLSTQFVEDYANYAEACFEAFGDRVKNWITFNEPHLVAAFGYGLGAFPPQRCSAPFGNCTAGNSSTEPYIVAHHFLLAHAAAVAIYRRRFQVIGAHSSPSLHLKFVVCSLKYEFKIDLDLCR